MHDTIAPMPPRPRPFRRPSLAVRVVAAMPPRLWTLAGRLLALRVRRLTQRPATAAEARLVGQILVIQGRFAEADAVLATALAAHPLDIGLMTRHATSAHNRGDYAEALVRWKRLRRAQPDDPSAWRGIAGNARELWDMPAATAAVREALRRFPDDPSILTEAALVANRRLDHAEALGHWTRLLEMRRVRPEVRQGHVYSLMRLHRFAEAEAALTAARGLHPDHAGLSATRAMMAMARADWDAAEALLHDHLIRHPGDAAGLNLVAETKLARALAAADAGLAAVPPVRAAIDTVEDEPARALLLGCESLGTDCEFGLVQRRHGAEPLGLLRWNTIPPDGLMRGLAERFAGVGDPANSRLSCLPASGEYYVSDTRLGLYMHTFVTRGSLDEAAFFAKMCARLAFLRDKFLADLEAAEKLFVYKARGGTRADLEALQGRLRAFGPVRLLAVREAGPGEPPGRVEPIADGLCLGTLRHYGDRGGPDWDIAFDDWLAVVDGARAAMPAPHGPRLIG